MMNKAIRWGTLATSLALALTQAGCGNDSSDIQQQESHYFKVKHIDGKIMHAQLIRIQDDKIIGIAYPYGMPSAKVLAAVPTQRMSVQEFGQLVKQQPKARSAQQATPAYTTGLAIGYNPSTGATGGLCYNFTTPAPTSPILNASFTITHAVQSLAQATKISASVQASYGAFSAKDGFTYSDSYQSSTNSGSAYLSANAIFTLNNAVDTSTKTSALTSFGTQQLNAGTFSQACGSAFMSIVPAGMVVTGGLTWASDSSQASTNIANNFSANYGLDKLSVAMQTTNSTAAASVTLNFISTILGGGSYASQILSDIGSNIDLLATCAAAAGVDTKTSSGSATLAQDLQDCDTFSAAVAQSVFQNVGAYANGLETTWPTNLDVLQVFPNGVSGFSTSTLQTIPASKVLASSVDDVLSGYPTKLANYLALINQMTTLQYRAKSLYSAVGNDQFNWLPILVDLQVPLNAVEQIYQTDAAALTSNLGTCLSPATTAANVTTQCAPIINNTFTNVYDWYGPGGANPNWLAQQNTIALQYLGTFSTAYDMPSDTTSVLVPVDVVYINPLGTLNSPAENISGQAGLAAFADAPYQWGPTEIAKNSSGALLPLPLTADLSDATTLVSGLTGFYGVFDQRWFGAGNPISWITPSCAPSFASPCELSYQVQNTNVQDVGTNVINMTQIPNFFTTTD
jgi:hypothetical protein